MLSRRGMLQGTAALAMTAATRTAFAQGAAALPIVFVHGDSDLAAIWQTTIWRFESNGYPRDRLFAISMTDPQARDDDTVAQANRSSTQDQLRELGGFVAAVRAKTGAPRIAIVALSRGGYATRGYVAAHPAEIAAVVLCRCSRSARSWSARSPRSCCAARQTTACSRSTRSRAANTTVAARS
jgi:pimeloyl-ACP methyl ester carboxylesterase